MSGRMSVFLTLLSLLVLGSTDNLPGQSTDTQEEPEVFIAAGDPAPELHQAGGVWINATESLSFANDRQQHALVIFDTVW